MFSVSVQHLPVTYISGPPGIIGYLYARMWESASRPGIRERLPVVNYARLARITDIFVLHTRLSGFIAGRMIYARPASMCLLCRCARERSAGISAGGVIAARRGE